MAKRKRLKPAQVDYLAREAGLETKALGPLGAPPIAQVAQEASTTAALNELAETLSTAKSEGRFVERLALDAIDMGYLTRDRMAIDEGELTSLIESLRARGQQMPIEVVATGEGRYGLISGWRRMTALKRLAEEDGRPATVLAQVRRPETAGEAYVAMVEENEIRVGLSYFERARIVVKAVDAGVFPHERAALQTLFAAASRARRSKIGSFMPVVRELGDALHFPAALPERLGLALGKVLETPAEGERLRAALAETVSQSAEAERDLLDRLLMISDKKETICAETETKSPAPSPAPVATDDEIPSWQVTPRLRLERRKEGLVITGKGVGPELESRLRVWLRSAEHRR